jgi:hypothetical protein
MANRKQSTFERLSNGHGLLRDSFHPPEKICALRSLWRLRDRHVKEAGRAILHMQKTMTVMNLTSIDGIDVMTA